MSIGTASEGGARRRLVAILAADVAGYSRLMEADESAALHALESCRAVFRKRIADHGGYVVDTAGDSVLAVFPSVVEAVVCAREIQGAIARLSDGVSKDRRMLYRIGVNLGDVIEKGDGSVYGDGVNVAARLEALAEPGGVIISGTAHDQVEGKVEAKFTFVGEQMVKNISRPVRAYRLVDEATTVHPTSAVTSRPSIAVLPFDNLSGDADQEYFADGIAEDLITALSRLRWLFVTARNSTFTYKGKPIEVKQVGREMGVHYVVEGSVRRGGKRVRISVQLIDANSGNHIWAERFDRPLDDLFALQDEITETVAAAIAPELEAVERERAHRKPPGSLDAWEAYQRGMWHLYRYSAEQNATARRLFRRAASLDPHFAAPLAWLAYALLVSVVFGQSRDSAQDLRAAAASARKALQLDNKDAVAHMTLGRVLGAWGNVDDAIEELREAITLSPNFAMGHFSLGFELTMSGQFASAVESFEKAIRLSPHDPNVWSMEGGLARSMMAMQKYEDALVYARRSALRPNAQFWAHAHLASCLGHVGRRDEAREAFNKLIKMRPDFSVALVEGIHPGRGREWKDSLFEGLRKAGLDVPDDAEAGR